MSSQAEVGPGPGFLSPIRTCSDSLHCPCSDAPFLFEGLPLPAFPSQPVAPPGIWGQGEDRDPIPSPPPTLHRTQEMKLCSPEPILRG